LHKPRIYIDTSVLGGCFDDEFKEWSNKLFDEFASGKKIAVVSDILIKELEDAPQRVKDKFNLLPSSFREDVVVDNEVIELANTYINENIVSYNYYNDALHIALATVNKIDILISWNFKHIVNYNKIILYNSVNIKMGYPYIEIRNPRELADEN